MRLVRALGWRRITVVAISDGGISVVILAPQCTDHDRPLMYILVVEDPCIVVLHPEPDDKTRLWSGNRRTGVLSLRATVITTFSTRSRYVDYIIVAGID
nr:hypothetical protein CFP56_28477 [Quercus suber]